MPELPEVETSRRGIEPYLAGQVIDHVTVRQSRLRVCVSTEISELTNQTVWRVLRKAKYLLLELTSGWIIIHLGMSGSLRILKQYQPPNKHDHIDLALTSGIILRYTDPRRFGLWVWHHDALASRYLQGLGPEPLDDDFSVAYLYGLITPKKKITVKQWIMNSATVCGVGNIYANESLFSARILPYRPINTLLNAEVERLVLSIKHIIASAIDQGGTTLKDFVNAEGKLGYFVQELKVYNRADQPCFTCNRSVERLKIGGRSTFYCINCQK